MVVLLLLCKPSCIRQYNIKNYRYNTYYILFIMTYLISFSFILQSAQTTIIIMSSIILLFVRLHSVSVNTLHSFTLLIAFSTLILTLAMLQDCLASCAVNLLSLIKLGIVKKDRFGQTGLWHYSLCQLKFSAPALVHLKCHSTGL